jgi:N-glycosylase/DNA lyase
MKKIKVQDFSLEKSVTCGQIFRWEKTGEFYYITAGDRIIRAKQEGNILFYDCSKGGAEFITKYFSLDCDYKKITAGISKDKKIRHAIKSAYGLRLISQGAFECMISYISSAASNIPRIRKNMNAIAKRFGHEISLGAYKSYSFPTPEEMLCCTSIEDEAKICGLGFRSKFYPKAISEIMNAQAGKNLSPNNAFSEYFKQLKKLDYCSAKKELVGLSGIGEKVADCILAFSLGFSEAFPTDVWIRRAVEEMYFPKKKISVRQAGEFGRKYFGKDAAYAQEFIYYWRRQ